MQYVRIVVDCLGLNHLTQLSLRWYMTGSSGLCTNRKVLLILAGNGLQAGVRCGFKDSKFKIFPHDELFPLIEKLHSRTDALPAVMGWFLVIVFISFLE